MSFPRAGRSLSTFRRNPCLFCIVLIVRKLFSFRTEICYASGSFLPAGTIWNELYPFFTWYPKFWSSYFVAPWSPLTQNKHAQNTVYALQKVVYLVVWPMSSKATSFLPLFLTDLKISTSGVYLFGCALWTLCIRICINIYMYTQT